MTTYDVAVLIIAHNSREDVAVCLTKLFEVSPADLSLQVILVDNTGSDGTPELVRARWPDVRLIVNAASQGFGANVNQAVVASDARYYLVMNPDVVLLQGAIESLVDYLETHPDTGVCGPRTLYPDGSLQATCRRFPHWGTVAWRWLKLDRIAQPEFYRRFLMLDWDHTDIRAVDWLMGSCLLIRREAFTALSGFDANFFMYYEDIDFCRRMWQAGFNVAYVAEAVVVHTYQRHSARGFFNPLTLEHIRSILRYRRKHGFAVGQISPRQALLNVTFLLILGDLVLTQIALQAARYARFTFPLFGAFPYPNPTRLRPLIYGLVPIIWLAVFSLAGLYRSEQVRHLAQQRLRLLVSVLLSGLVLAGSIYALFLYNIYIPRLLLAYFLFFNVVLLFGERALLGWLLSRNGIFYRPRALLVGKGQVSENLADWAGGDQQARIDVLNVRPWPDNAGDDVDGISTRAIVETVRQLQIDEVVLTPPWPNRAAVEDIVRALRSEPVQIKIVPDFLDLALYRPHVEQLYGVTLVSLRSSAIKGGRRVAKRLFDLVVSIPLVVLLSPLFGLIAVAIKLDSPGPALFTQQRVGENGRLFWVHKFRSMEVDADKKFTQMLYKNEVGQLVYKVPEDPRVTHVGRWLRRWSLDELPQLWNVIKGEMSLVGPRPELPFFVMRYEDWQYKRLVVPPGMTGWWQVRKRGVAPLHLATEEDLYYIEHYSIWLDITVLLRTIWVVLTRRGAY